MDFLASQIIDWLSMYVWSLARISGLLMTMVNIGSKTTPIQVRISLALAITIAVTPILPPGPNIELLSVAAFVVIAQQLLIGIAVGFASVLFMQTFVIAGQVIAMQTSLGFAAMVDPSNGQSAPVIGQFYMLLATLIFFSLDGHLSLIYLTVESFHTLPVDQVGLQAPDFKAIASWFSLLFATALAMSLSSIVAMLAVNLSFGVMTRSAPQLNIFSLGFSISMVFGLFILWMTIGSFLGHYEHQWQETMKLVCQVLKGPC